MSLPLLHCTQRLANAFWSVIAAGAGAPPSLNVDVPRMLLREFFHRMNRARARRTQELEALLRRKDLPVGHGRVSLLVFAA